MFYYLYESEDYEGGDIVGPLYETLQDAQEALNLFLNTSYHKDKWQKKSDRMYKHRCTMIEILEIDVHKKGKKCEKDNGCFICRP